MEFCFSIVLIWKFVPMNSGPRQYGHGRQMKRVAQNLEVV